MADHDVSARPAPPWQQSKSPATDTSPAPEKAEDNADGRSISDLADELRAEIRADRLRQAARKRHPL